MLASGAGPARDVFCQAARQTVKESFVNSSIMKLFSVLLRLGVALTLERGVAVAASSCRNLPGDAGWPSAAEWNKFNSTVGGRLVATIPLGSPCHEPTYVAAECASLQSQWLEPQLQYVPETFVRTPEQKC